MFRDVRILTAAATIGVAVALLTGCSSGSPSDPGGILRCLYIGGDYLRVTGDPPQGFGNGASIEIRYGSRAGRVAPGLEVDINGYQLTFYADAEVYMGVVPGLGMGDTLTISVSDGAEALSQSIQVPYAPSSLELEGDAWDISEPSSVNRLTWDNPDQVAQALVVGLYDYDGFDAELLGEMTAGEPDYDSLTLTNAVLPYYETLDGVGAVVSQVNYVGFPDNPDDSMVAVHACAIRTWPVSSGD